VKKEESEINGAIECEISSYAQNVFIRMRTQQDI
jgi:hypothetical protein